MVTNVEVEVTSASSVRVSWDILDIPEIVNYRVYYSRTGQEGENTTTVPSSADSVEISGLLTGEEYQFQVVAVADLDGNLTVGQRSNSSVPEVVVQGDLMFVVMYVVVLVFMHVLSDMGCPDFYDYVDARCPGPIISGCYF